MTVERDMSFQQPFSLSFLPFQIRAESTLQERPIYPFPATVGQEKAKLALILNAIDPTIGGVLLTGVKGSGKSLLVRAFAGVLPEITVVKNCTFNCDPKNPADACEECRSRIENGDPLITESRTMRIVQMPLSATEDRVLGSIDVERALREGTRAFQPGLLAEANRNILYIDEVNLLSDHLVNSILDAASSGWNVVEREGVSVTHPSRFVLIGSMNPEEGDLRPQILDRFALHTQTDNIEDAQQRIEIMRRNLEFETDPATFRSKYEAECEEIRLKIADARKRLPQVSVPEEVFQSVAQVCAEIQVDGHRPDIVAVRAARAFAAFNGRTRVQPEDVVTVAELALSHRTRRAGLEEPAPPKLIRESVEQALQHFQVWIEPEAPTDGIRWKPDAAVVLEEARAKSIKVNVPSPSRPSIMPRFKKPPTSQILATILFFALPFVLFFLLTHASIFVLRLFVRSVTMETWGSAGNLAAVVVAAIGTMLYLIWSILHKPKAARYVPALPEVKGRTGRLLMSELEPPKDFAEGEYIYQIDTLGGAIGGPYRAVVGHGRKVVQSLNDLIQMLAARAQFRMPLEQWGKRTFRRAAVTKMRRGRYVWFEFPKEKAWDIAVAPTIRAAAPHQLEREPEDLAVKVESRDVRVKVREYRAPLAVMLLLDMSESMIASLENVRQVVLSSHKNAYRHRDRVGLTVFKGSEAVVVQQPTTNLNLVVRKLLQLGASDYTPLAAGMMKAWQALRMEKRRDKDVVPVLIIVSDGIVNVPLEHPLSAFTRSSFSNPAQADALDAAHVVAKEKIQTIIVNTDHRVEEVAQPSVSTKAGTRWFTPTGFLIELARVTNGYYCGLLGGREDFGLVPRWRRLRGKPLREALAD